MAYESPTLKRLAQDKRDALKALYDQCTPKQQNLFNQMYGSVNTIPAEKIDWAIQQCERAIAKNNAKAAKEES